MITIAGSAEIAGYNRYDVFDVAIHKETWPKIPGIVLEPQDDVLSESGILLLGISLPFVNKSLSGQVTEFVRGTRLSAEGKAFFGKAAIGFDLFDLENKVGTHVEYSLIIEPKGILRISEPMIDLFAKDVTERTTSTFIDNILSSLNGRHSTNDSN